MQISFYSAILALLCSTTAVLAVTFEAPVKVLDHYGTHLLTISKCTNWDNNNVQSCFDNQPTGTVQWVSCAVGSSPRGKAPGDRAHVCGDVTDTFTCSFGQNCFAVVDVQQCNAVYKK